LSLYGPPTWLRCRRGVGNDDGDTAAGVEAEGGVRDEVGDGDGVPSREVALREVAASREAVVLREVG
jgi:hypothetical protein